MPLLFNHRTEASVEEHDTEPIGRMDSAEVFAARHEGQTVTTKDRQEGEDGPVVTEHTRVGTVVMYKPFAGGYSPRTVAVSAIRQLLRQGWAEFCPDCHGEHLDRNGNPSTDPNLCSAKEPIAVRVCPVCGKRIYDNMGAGEQPLVDGSDDDPNVIRDDAFSKTTEKSRTQISLNIHMWARHPRQAMMRGIDPLPDALKELVSDQRPV